MARKTESRLASALPPPAAPAKGRSRRVILEFVFNGTTPIVRKPALMNRFRQALTIPTLCALFSVASPESASAQARPIEVPEINTQFTASGVANLRVGSISEDGTEALLVMEYTYNGNTGPTALIVPVIESRRQPGVSGWFGADRVSVPRGKGLISIKVKFFNDEPGVPAAVTTDSIRILILNSTGTGIIGGSTELKTISWGKAGAQPAKTAAPPAADRRLAQLAGEAEERAREKARLAAEAEQSARREMAEREAARARAAAEARAATEAKEKAEAEARVRAEEKRKAEEKAAAEAQAREEAGRKAEAEARRLAEERRAAEARAKAQAEAQEKARLEAEARKREEEQRRAEAEAARLQEEKRQAEAKAAAEARARAEAEAKAQAEARRLEDERKAAEERLRAEEEAKRLAAEREAAEAKAREQAEAQAAEAARIKAEQEAAEAARLKAEQQAQAADDATGGRSRTKITNVDVVNRSLDRSQMTIGIEFDRKDKFNYLGVNVAHSANPAVKGYFTCEPKEVGRQKYALVQVAYSKPSAAASTVVTDRLLIYGSESPGAPDPIALHTATMLLVWRAPGAATAAPVDANPAVTAADTVEITDFRQRTPTSGYASVTYQLAEGAGQLRVRLKNSAQAGSSAWFITEPVTVKAGQGLELIPVTVSADQAPAGTLNVDAVEVELLGADGKVISQASKTTSITWSRTAQ